MALTLIGLGTVADDGTGDFARVGGAKINSCMAVVNTLSASTPVSSYGPLSTVMSDWLSGAVWGQPGPAPFVRASASSGNTDLHGIVSSGAPDGQEWTYFNPSASDSTKLNNESFTCTTSADRILTPGGVLDIVPPQGYARFRKDLTLNRWTRRS